MSEKQVVHANKANQQGFTLVPNSVLLNPDLSLGARMLYGLLKTYAWQKDSCWPGLDRLGPQLGVSHNTIRSYRDELVKSKLLKVQRRGQGKTNVYTICEPRPAKTELLDTQLDEHKEDEGNETYSRSGVSNEEDASHSIREVVQTEANFEGDAEIAFLPEPTVIHPAEVEPSPFAEDGEPTRLSYEEAIHSADRFLDVWEQTA